MARGAGARPRSPAALDEARRRALELHLPHRRRGRSHDGRPPATARRAAADGARHGPRVHGDLGAVAHRRARPGTRGVHRRRRGHRRAVLRDGLGRGSLAVHRGGDGRAHPHRGRTGGHRAVVHRHPRRAPSPRSRPRSGWATSASRPTTSVVSCSGGTRPGTRRRTASCPTSTGCTSSSSTASPSRRR